MRRLWVVVGCLVAMGIATGAGAANPSLLGPTGLLLTPTADTLGTLEFNLGATLINVDEDTNITALYGNVCVFPRLEIGATLLDADGSDAETFLNVKYRIIGLPGELTLAAGVFDVTDEIDQSVYAVLSHDIGAGIIKPKGIISRPRIHIGLGGGRYDGLFGGLSFQSGDKTEVIAEYDSDNINLGLRYSPVSKLALTAAALDGFNDFGFGASVNSPW